MELYLNGIFKHINEKVELLVTKITNKKNNSPYSPYHVKYKFWVVLIGKIFWEFTNSKEADEHFKSLCSKLDDMDFKECKKKLELKK